MYSVSPKNPPPLKFFGIFPKWLGIFSPNFTRLLYVPNYARLQICIHLPATVTVSATTVLTLPKLPYLTFGADRC